MMNEHSDTHMNSNDKEYLTLTPVNLIRQLAYRMKEHDVAALGAQMTYYLILSVFPFLMVLLNLIAYAGLFDAAMLDSISEFMPGESGQMIVSVIGETVTASSAALFSVSMLAALWSSTKGVGALIKGFNKAYDHRESRPFWKVKGIAILFTIGLIAVIFVVLVMLVMGEVIGQELFDTFDAGYLSKWCGTYFAISYRWEACSACSFCSIALRRIGRQAQERSSSVPYSPPSSG